ncbi:hypothetical protein WJX72_005757 [[Myrmecia] bisecta]|uniref:TRP C-terminal domain-containing protein n=1 Tax=[Myrmecia] bisecta TaxID=41462 RepID=A0AAW1R6S3_9CHLO
MDTAPVLGAFYQVTAFSGGTLVAASAPTTTAISALIPGVAYAYPAPYGLANSTCSWAAPCSDLQAAIDATPSTGYTFAGPGTYTGVGNRELSFRGQAKTVVSFVGATYTIIDAQGLGRAFVFNSGESYGSVLSGFTFTNGMQDYGGAILIDTASPVIANCNFFNCFASNDGGAIHVSGPVTVAVPTTFPIITGANFTGNRAQNGAGVWVNNAGANITLSVFLNCRADLVTASRGGAIAGITAGFFLEHVHMENCYAAFSGGAIHTEAAITLADAHNITMLNCQADAFGGGINIFAGANFTFVDSQIIGNTAGFHGGGAIVTYGFLTLLNTVVSGNSALFGGGGIKALAGVVQLDGCTVTNNQATDGGGFEVAKATGAAIVPTILVVKNSFFSGNAAVGKGGCFNLASCNATLIQNVTFANNVGTRGGVAYISAENVGIYASTFKGNNAQFGGAIYGFAGCRADIQYTTFDSNVAKESGGGIITGDDVQMNIAFCQFINNGNYSCYEPPNGGGALNVGVDEFNAQSGCAVRTTAPSFVQVSNSAFRRNVAKATGGAIGVQSGTLIMSTSDVSGNAATGKGGSGYGGGVYVAETCTGSLCTTATAIISGCSLTNNLAHLAGGALFYTATTAASSVTLTGGLVSGNRVDYAATDLTKSGLGGGVFLARNNFKLSGVAFVKNAAYLGGGVFLGADLSSNALLDSLTFVNNTGILGEDVYWLRAQSPNASLSCSGCSYAPGVGSSIATEVLAASYLQQPAGSVQSAETAPQFGVGLRDFYGHLASAESAGECVVEYTGSALTIPDFGRRASIEAGQSTFRQFQVTGGIGASFQLNIACAPSTTGQNPFLPATYPLAPISFPLTVANCPPGTRQAGEICQACDQNTYNFDGRQCLKCPAGGVCPGGTEGTVTAIQSLQGYWRAGNTSLNLYRCTLPASCLGRPNHPGSLAGDASCIPGSVGPLCSVCAPGYYQFSGKCQSCGAAGQAKAMLGVSVIVLAFFLAAIFARDWGDAKGGMMTKIKILVTHVQLLALLRDYDVVWPDATHRLFGWSDSLNLGVSITAPACYLGSEYNFYFYWIITMAMPVCSVLGCIVVHFVASRVVNLLRSYEEAASETPRFGCSGKFKQKLRDWLEGVKTRCWKNGFWLITLLYPRCSMTALQFFATQKLDLGTYLRADYSILIRPLGGSLSRTYVHYLVPGIFMLVVFAILIPLAYALILYRIRNQLEDPIIQRKFGFLYGGYRLTFWETTEMIRKLLLAAIPVFIAPQPYGSAQAVLGQLLTIGYLVAVVYCQPYEVPMDNHLQTGSHIIIWLFLVSGESLKWAVLSESQILTVEAGQLLLTSSMALVVILACLVKAQHISRARRSIWYKKIFRGCFGVGKDKERVHPLMEEDYPQAAGAQADYPGSAFDNSTFAHANNKKAAETQLAEQDPESGDHRLIGTQLETKNSSTPLL